MIHCIISPELPLTPQAADMKFTDTFILGYKAVIQFVPEQWKVCDQNLMTKYAVKRLWQLFGQDRQ